jgi:hypothetical protein
MELETLIEETKAAKSAVERAKLDYANGMGSYDAMLGAARRFADSFYRYQMAKFGKAQRVDPRTVLRQR